MEKPTTYTLGEKVEVYLEVTVDGQKFSKWAKGFITSVEHTYSEGGKEITMYVVSASKPQQWHSPTVIRKRKIARDDLRKSSK